MRRRQGGAAIVETVIALPVLLTVIMGAVQWGMIYRAKATVNHAVLQAARAGAVNGADPLAMRLGLAKGLLPLYSPESSGSGVLTALREAGQDVAAFSSVRVMNPTREAFDDFGETQNNERVIPSDRLDRRPTQVGGKSGVNIQDANLLRVQVRYSYSLSVPVVGRFITGIASFTNRVSGKPDAWEQAMLSQGRLPIMATSTVRMQTPAKLSSAILAKANLESPERVPATGGEPPNKPSDTGSGGAGRATATAYNRDGSSLNDGFLGLFPYSTGGGTGRGGPGSPPGSTPGAGGGGTGAPGAGGGGPGSAEGDPNNPPLCTPQKQATGSTSDPADDQTVLGRVYSALKSIAGEALEFVKGFWEGIKSQLTDFVDLITDPLETAKGLYELAKKFITEPVETAKQVGSAIGRDLGQLLFCGAYDKGRVLGANIDPAVALKFVTVIAKAGKLSKAVKLLERESKFPKLPKGCASFAAGTLVWASGHAVPIETVHAGLTVDSRSAETFLDSPQPVWGAFNREAPSYYRITTEQDQLLVTDEHPFWVQGRGWTPVKDIEEGTPVATAEGDTLIMSTERVAAPLHVFNFSVPHTESYFVGSERIWVHNASFCDPVKRAEALRKQAERDAKRAAKEQERLAKEARKAEKDAERAAKKALDDAYRAAREKYGVELPRQGSFAGEIGNSPFTPNEGSPLADAIKEFKKPDGTPHTQIEYKNGFPDFEPFAFKNAKGEVVKFEDIPFTNRNADIKAANKAYKAMYGEKPPKGYTWHHLEDCKTLILIKSVVHNASQGGVPHTGGDSLHAKGAC